MEPHRIRIGVIGAGDGAGTWGARGHLPAIQALDDAELVAVCTAREETARRAQQRTHAPLAFWDYREMVRSPDIDLVTIAVRVSLHHPIVVAALNAGKHVFCEWPLALDAARAVEMHALARQRGVHHAAGIQARFSPGVMYARTLLKQGYVGRPLLFYMTHLLATALAPPSHRAWLLRGDEGGGALLIAAGHALDVVRWLLGEVTEVCAKVQTLVPEARLSDTGEVVSASASDTVACMLRLATGVTGTAHVSTVCRHGSGFRLEVYGTEGRLLVESPHMVQYSPATVSGARGTDGISELAVPEELHEVATLPAESQAFQLAQLLRQFIRATREGIAFHPDFGDAVALHRVLEAMARSSHTGRWEAAA